MRLAAYLRDSGGDRQENSTDRQLAEIQSWAARSGIILSQVFTDSARPGSSTVGRDAFQEMIHFFRSPACDLDGLVIWSWSRFARDINDAQFFRADLRRRGFEIYSVSDPIPDGPMGRFIEAAIDWKNQQFLADLSKDVKSGLASLVRDHGAVPGTPPRGFIREPIDLGRHRSGGQRIVHRWVPDPALVPLVRQAWHMKAAGASIRDIQTTTGLYKSKNSWVTFFQNKLYIGILEYADFTIPDYCEPIITQEIWDTVQANLEPSPATPHHKHPRRVNSSYLLSGIAHCARCASPLTGHTRASYRAYACSRARRAYTCDLRPIPAVVVETAVLTELSHFISSPQVLIAERNRLQTQFAAQSAQLTAQIASHRQKLGILRRQISHLTDAIAESGHSPALLQRLGILEQEEHTALENIATLQRQLDLGTLSHTDADLETLAASNRRALAALPQDQLHTLLLGLVHTITLDRTDRTILGEITFYYPPTVKKKKLGL